MRVVGTVSRLIQLSPRIAVGFGNGLSEPALLLGGRQLGNEVDPSHDVGFFGGAQKQGVA